jgi:hypothetical protein
MTIYTDDLRIKNTIDRLFEIGFQKNEVIEFLETMQSIKTVERFQCFKNAFVKKYGNYALGRFGRGQWLKLRNEKA